MAKSLRVLLVGGPMYDPLYARLEEFEAQEGIDVEAVVVPSHPDLNERIEEEFGSGAASYDLLSTHAKYAPSQRRWLTPLDDDLEGTELEPFALRPMELARIEGSLYGVPRNLDVKLLYYRTDLVPEPPRSWEELRDEAARLRSDNVYGFVFPGKESGLFGHFFELHAMAGGRMFGESGPLAPRLNDEAGRAAGDAGLALRRGGRLLQGGQSRDVHRLARWLLHLRGPRDERRCGLLRRRALPRGEGGALHLLGLPHLRDTCYGPRSSRGGPAAAFPHLARVAGARSRARNAPGAQRLSGGRPVRGPCRFAGRAEVGSAGGGAGGGPHPAQARELPRGGGRHLAGCPRGAPGQGCKR